MTETRSHHIVQHLNHSAEDVFKALITPSHIRKWWSASQVIVIPAEGGIWCATWGKNEDAPDFISSATIKEFKQGRRLVLNDYKYVSPDGGLPFEADFETSFEIIVNADGGIDLTIDQVGFPNDPVADEYYNGCEQGWKDTLESLEKFLDLQLI